MNQIKNWMVYLLCISATDICFEIQPPDTNLAEHKKSDAEMVLYVVIPGASAAVALDVGNDEKRRREWKQNVPTANVSQM